MDKYGLNPDVIIKGEDSYAKAEFFAAWGIPNSILALITSQNGLQVISKETLYYSMNDVYERLSDLKRTAVRV